MSRIETVYIVNNSHTDIGYTDHPDVVFRQHAEYVDQAIELCETTADYPPEAQFKWTCEVAAVVERYLKERPNHQIERFLKLHHEGRMAVAAMSYHWTPLLSPPAMIRSLYPLKRLRKEYGLRIASAIQNDVNGVSWLWADLLPAVGVSGLTMGINQHRGRRPQPDLRGFWWEGPGGGRLLTLNGPHYPYGIFRYGLGNRDQARELLRQALQKLEDEGYPYNLLYAQVTHPARVDNGGPDARLPDFVREWNAAGEEPRLIITTVDTFLEEFRENYSKGLETWRGDWADWWADGVASSAYETALNRRTEGLLPLLDFLSSHVDELEPNRIDDAFEQISLYDEHTWGFFASVSHPSSPFTKALWNKKAGYAYTGFALTHELLADGARALARSLTGARAEGDVGRTWRSPLSVNETSHRFLVINPLPWSRKVVWPLPADIDKPRPHGILASLLAAEHNRPLEPDVPNTGDLLLEVELPAFGYETVAYREAYADSTLGSSEGGIENTWYRIQIDPRTGGIASFYDKELDRELAGQDGPWRLGQFVYETVASADGRRAIFAVDYGREDYGHRHKDTPFRRRGARRVELAPARTSAMGASLEARLTAPGARSVRVRYVLPAHRKALQLELVVDKDAVHEPESVYVVLPFALKSPKFRLDLNGVPLEPEAEQLPGSCRDWYGVQTWAGVSDGETSIVLVPIDAPLVQLGGIQTGRWACALETPEATLISWAMHNHWDTNFKAFQSGEITLRYELTSFAGEDWAAAGRFAAEAFIPPLVIGVPEAPLGIRGQFVELEPQGVAKLFLKRAANGHGLILQTFNLTAERTKLLVGFLDRNVRAAWWCSPLEEDIESLVVEGNRVELELPPRSFVFARVLL